MEFKARYILLLLIVGPVLSQAQFRLPPFEINLKAGYSVMITDGGPQMINLQGGLHVPINQYISVGWLYARTAYGTAYDDEVDKDYTTQELITGPEVRISGGRSRKLRPYLVLSYAKFEIVTDYESYRNASKSSALGGHLGLMLKLGNKMYLNLIEVGMRKLSDEPFWINENAQVEIKTGLSYNFGKKK